MIDYADVNLSGPDGVLGVTTEAQVRVGIDEHFPIDGTVGVVADGAAFAHRLMLEHYGPGLLAMTLRAAFVVPRHRQSARGFEDVAAVRVVALHAVHMALDDRMMLRQVELRFGLGVALEARGRVLAGIHDEPAASAADFDVFAPGTMAGLAAALSARRHAFHAQSRVRTAGKTRT